MPPEPLPGPIARPRLSLGANAVRLSSPRGDVVEGALALTNRGDAPLEGVITVRLGTEWLRVETGALRLAPGETRRVMLRAVPGDLPAGYTQGEIQVTSNGGVASVPVRLGVRTGRGWRLFAAATTACIALTVLVGVLLAGVKLPAAAPSPPHRATTSQQHHTGTHPAAPTALPTINRVAALAAIRDAIASSNAIWQSALTLPSASALSSVKTGRDLALATAEVRDLAAHGEHWQITVQSFQVLPGQEGVSAEGRSGWGMAQKTERRALYGPDHPSTPYMDTDATYRLRYHLVLQHGHWLVDNIAVLAVTPLAPTSPLPSVEAVTTRLAPVVMHVEAGSADQIAVGTGIVIYSSANTSYVITNDHVVTGAQVVKVQRWDGTARRYTPVIVTHTWREDAADDLAVIQIDHGNLPVATWGDSDALQPGQEVVAVGYAEDLAGGPTVTDGIVSSLLRMAPGDSSGRTYIGHSATINHGNSGGPLADMSGNIVGINTWTLDNTQGLFFAIPSTRAARVAAGFIGTNG